MKIGPAGLTKLAEMICGDAPYTYFPYRSSSYLTPFFRTSTLTILMMAQHADIGYAPFRMISTTTRLISENMPSREMVKVIEYLLNPDHFTGYQDADHEKAVNKVNELLKSYELRIIVDNRTKGYSLSLRTVSSYQLQQKIVCRRR